MVHMYEFIMHCELIVTVDAVLTAGVVSEPSREVASAREHPAWSRSAGARTAPSDVQW